VLNNSQLQLDKLENQANSKKETQLKSLSSKDSEKLNAKQINAIIISLIEFSEHNCDLFETMYSNFQEISQTLFAFLISSVKSFRMLMNRVLINFSYFIPSWRTQLLTLILNLTSVSHAEVAALKNTFMYVIDENSPEYKYSLILRNNLELLKDISNCLANILSVFSHKNSGIPLDLSNAALTVAKNMIIGKFADEEDTPKAISIKEKASKYSYSNLDSDAHKEAGWIVIQGLASMDYTWLTNNFKILFQLWKYIFNDTSCLVDENELQKPEYREALLSEFFIKKAALSALRKFILASYDFINAQSFQILIPKFLASALLFFIPHDKKKVNYFFRQILKEKYREAKIFLYDCYLSIPINLFSSKFIQILYSVCDDITAEYTDYSYEYINSNLNWYDSFMCEKNLIFTNNHNENQINNYIYSFSIENFGLEKFNIAFSNQFSNDINSKLVESSVNLIVEILLDNNLNLKNRQQIFKHFLTHMSDLSSKSKESTKIIKAINIVYCLYMILKKSYKRNITIINDESIFANSKMIFDIGYKIDSPYCRRICSEGHALLIKVSSNPSYNMNYYLT